MAWLISKASPLVFLYIAVSLIWLAKTGEAQRRYSVASKLDGRLHARMINNVTLLLSVVCVIGVWLGTEHHIQDRAILKAIVVVGGGGADAKGMLC